MSEEMTHRVAVGRAWECAEDGDYNGAQAWAAVAGQLPFVETPAFEPLRVRGAMPMPRPLERDPDPTNVQTAPEIDREQVAANAALHGESVPDPRPMPNTAVPQPGTGEVGDDGRHTATCMCGIGIWWNAVAWCHDNGGGVCPR